MPAFSSVIISSEFLVEKQSNPEQETTQTARTHESKAEKRKRQVGHPKRRDGEREREIE